MSFKDTMWVYKRTEKELLKEDLPKFLKKYGYVPQIGEKFVYAEGNIPLLLVSHADTVHKAPPLNILWDKEYNIAWSPTGLGADDRAGVAAILEIIKKGYRPHILFTDEEESGCGGAKEAMKAVTPDVRYVIELDRKGSEDCIFYSCNNEDFTKYIESYGFKKAEGSLSDISSLCPYWGIAGVNLSIGYYNAHTNAEYLVISEWEETIKKVEAMLQSTPDFQFQYIEKILPKLDYSLRRTSYLSGYDWSKSYDKSYDLGGYYHDLYGESYSSYFASSIDFSISALDLYDCNGISVDFWKKWIKENRFTIESWLYEAVLEWAEDDAITQADYLEEESLLEDDEVIQETVKTSSNKKKKNKKSKKTTS